MKRFIDLDHQLYLCKGDDTWAFAWYCTVRSKFEEFSEKQVWASWDEFEQDFLDQAAWDDIDSDKLIKYWNLYPKDKR